MSRAYSERVGMVEVRLVASEDETAWTVVTRWLNADGTLMTSGRKTFTGQTADLEAAAFGNSILFDEWKRHRIGDRPTFSV